MIKTMLRNMCIAALGTACSLSAHAVVETGHWTVTNDLTIFGNANTAIAIDQTLSGDTTGSFFQYSATTGTLTYVTNNTDEGSELTVTRLGNVIDRTSFRTGWSGAVQVGRDFYLAAATSSIQDPGTSWSNYKDRTTFGWAHFRTNADGKLFIVDSAMAFREPGIIVGTLTTPVPEPASWLGMGLGFIGLGWARRQRDVSCIRS